jgi:hypothetical protein
MDAKGYKMSEPLATYLNDHLGGARIAMELLEAMRDKQDNEAFREFARQLVPDVEADDETLQRIIARIGATPSAAKEAGGWLLEKLARLKLGHTGSADFRLFESLELMVLGIWGKLALWKALQKIASLDVRLTEFNFVELIARAQDQYERTEKMRLTMANSLRATQGEVVN